MDFEHALLDAGNHGAAHMVQFYEDEALLGEAVARYSAAALGAGHCVLWIASPQHLESFRAALLETQEEHLASIPERLITRDARQLLAAFMVDGSPDPLRFKAAIQPLLKLATSRGPVSAYGEMVDLLFQDGNPGAALAVEALWNGLAAEWDFHLLCAYAMRNFPAGADGDPFRAVCGAHTHVVPTEEFSRLESEEHRRREISSLQQRARALEHELERRKVVEARLTEALRLRDDFVAVAGHELRTPLTSLGLMMQLLERTAVARGDKELAAQVSRAERQVRRLRTLSEELLDVSVLSAGTITLTREPFELGGLVLEVMSRASMEIGRSGCQVGFSSQEPVIGSWDRVRLEQVIGHLLANALKYGDRKPVQLSLTLPAGARRRVRLAVTDQGIGMDAEAQRRIFTRFERAVSAENYGGLGLGLWISRQLIEAHGGTVSVQSQPGQGSCFAVELPLPD